MNNIRIYNKEERQYKILKLFAEMVNDNLTSGYMALEDIYFDMGQNWKYTALVTHKEDGVFGSWQSFCPRDYELILYTDSIAILEKMAKYYAEKLNENAKSIYLYEVF